MSARRPLLAALLALLLGACASAPRDDGAYLEHMPTSILVLPPLDETPEVDAGPGFLATVTRPLAEQGYYVFPVAVVDRLLRENGLPDAHEMHQVPLDKLDEVFGADAVLYVTLTDWGTEYLVLSSVTSVGYRARLVDVATGTTLWQGSGLQAQSSSDGGGGIVGALIGAVISQVATSVSDPSPGVARNAHRVILRDGRRGLLLGEHHPGFEEQQRLRRESQAERGGTAPEP